MWHDRCHIGTRGLEDMQVFGAGKSAVVGLGLDWSSGLAVFLLKVQKERSSISGNPPTCQPDSVKLHPNPLSISLPLATVGAIRNRTASAADLALADALVFFRVPLQIWQQKET